MRDCVRVGVRANKCACLHTSVRVCFVCVVSRVRACIRSIVGACVCACVSECVPVCVSACVHA